MLKEYGRKVLEINRRRYVSEIWTNYGVPHLSCDEKLMLDDIYAIWHVEGSQCLSWSMHQWS